VADLRFHRLDRRLVRELGQRALDVAIGVAQERSRQANGHRFAGRRTQDGVGASISPLTHTPVFISHLLCRILTGATTVLLEKFDLETLLDTVVRHGVTDLPLIGGMTFEMVAMGDVPAAVRQVVRKVSVGGAPTPMGAKRELQRIFAGAEVIEAYGQTESTNGVTMALEDLKKKGYITDKGPNGPMVESFILFSRLFDEKRYEKNLFADISALTQVKRARYLAKVLERTDWLPGAIGSSLLVVLAWSYFIWTGSISTIWPMFGVSNQPLASIALCVGTTVLINSGKLRYAWITILPLSFVATTTLTAGWLNIVDNFLPLARTGGHPFQGYLNALMTAVMMACVLTILVDSVRRWTAALRSSRAAAPAAP
jgi:acyl-CoA synthetase (AMP-forming)/AMP-acid ligase II